MAHEDDPVRAVHCAIEIRKRLKELPTPVQSCVGIATGATICGLVGNETRLEYTAVGSAVILAARLMQNANCCILVNEDTLKACSRTHPSLCRALCRLLPTVCASALCPITRH
jgi:adenylate cyclase